MALGDSYVTLAEYRASLSSGETAANADITRNLKSISRYIDWKLGYQQTGFCKDATTSVRLYDGTGMPDLRVDAIATKTDLVVTVDDDLDGGFDHDTALAAGDFELRPLNADKGPQPRPWTWLKLPERGDRREWPRESLVKVEAKHGWMKVPNGIKDATIQFAAMLRVESTYATMQIQQIDTVVQASPQARSILKGLAEQYRTSAPLVVMV